MSRAVLGIALTGLAIGGAWLAVAITAAVAIGRATQIATNWEASRVRPDPEVVVDMDASPLLGVVLPRAPSWTS